MKTSSAKSKGRRLQKYIAQQLSETYNLPWGVDQDISSREMGQSGTDIRLSPLAKQTIPFDIEAKNQETWSIPAWWAQCLSNTSEGRTPLLVCSKNRFDTLAVLRFEDLLRLIKDGTKNN